MPEPQPEPEEPVPEPTDNGRRLTSADPTLYCAELSAQLGNQITLNQALKSFDQT